MYIMLDRLVEPKLSIEHVPYVLISCFDAALSALAETDVINIRIVMAILLIFPLITSKLSPAIYP